MLTIIGHTHMLPIVENFGYADHLMNSWKLDASNLKFIIKGNLPFEPELLAEQPQLLRYVLEQTYSKETISIMLNLQKQQKQRCNVLEEQLVNMIIRAMEMSELAETHSSSLLNSDDYKFTHTEWVWLHLSSQLIYFVLFQFVSFLHIIQALNEKVNRKRVDNFRGDIITFPFNIMSIT